MEEYMARFNNSSPHPDKWTNAKLMAEARKYANLESFSGSCGVEHGQVVELKGFPHDNGPALRETTRIYRDSWLNPILDELQRRFLKEEQ
jgi:hypothetical protein